MQLVLTDAICHRLCDTQFLAWIKSKNVTGKNKTEGVTSDNTCTWVMNISNTLTLNKGRRSVRDHPPLPAYIRTRTGRVQDANKQTKG